MDNRIIQQVIGGRKIAGFIGRFQPWHTGHNRILNEMVKCGYQPLLFLGTSNRKRNILKNPFTFAERVEIILEASTSLYYSNGEKVNLLFFPIFDLPKHQSAQPYLDKNNRKICHFNTAWFKQFIDMFDSNGITPNNFHLFYSIKPEDRLNYFLKPFYQIGETTITLETDIPRIYYDSHLADWFRLYGCIMNEIKHDYHKPATCIRDDLALNNNYLVANTFRTIQKIIEREKVLNAQYDSKPDDGEINQNAWMSILHHERRRTKKATLEMFKSVKKHPNVILPHDMSLK